MNKEPVAAVPVAIGRTAPGLHLLSTPDQVLPLQEFRDRPVVLVFYPTD